MNDLIQCQCGKNAVQNASGVATEKFYYFRLNSKGNPICRRCEEREDPWLGSVVFVDYTER